MQSGTHLATVSSEMYERKWERFQVKRPARIMAVSPGLSGVTIRSCEVIDVSRGGAGLEVTTGIGLAKHYYLQIIGLADRIGCAEVYRNGNRIGVKFISAISEQLLHDIVRADFRMGDDVRQKRPGPTVGLGLGPGQDRRI